MSVTLLCQSDSAFRMLSLLILDKNTREENQRSHSGELKPPQVLTCHPAAASLKFCVYHLSSTLNLKNKMAKKLDLDIQNVRLFLPALECKYKQEEKGRKCKSTTLSPFFLTWQDVYTVRGCKLFIANTKCSYILHKSGKHSLPAHFIYFNTCLLSPVIVRCKRGTLLLK